MDGNSNGEEPDRGPEATDNRYQMLFENTPIVIWEHDFSESKAYVDELAQETGDFRAYLDANPEELSEIFKRVRTIGVNQNAVEYYKADSKDHLLNNVDQVLDEEAWELTKDLWASVAAGEMRFRGKTVARTFDGDRRHQMLDLFVPEPHSEDYGRVYMTGTDIDELVQRERELKRERDRLDEFAKVVAHDLRNLLNVASGRIAFAKSECESDHLSGAADGIARSINLLDDLHSLAQSGELISEMESVDLDQLVQTCWVHVETADATIRAEVDCTIRADRSRLEQLLENLIQNAVEHGGPNVIIRIGELSNGFYIEDDGAGIPPEDRDEVFKPSVSTNQDGTGLGLNIVEQIVDAHQWEISVTNGQDGGARFEITGVGIVAE